MNTKYILNYLNYISNNVNKIKVFILKLIFFYYVKNEMPILYFDYFLLQMIAIII